MCLLNAKKPQPIVKTRLVELSSLSLGYQSGTEFVQIRGFFRSLLVIQDNDEPLAVLLKYEHFLASRSG